METGSDEEEDEDEDEEQMYVSGMRGGGKKKLLLCVCQASSVPWGLDPRGNQLFVVDTDSDIFSVDIGVTPPCPLRLVEGAGDKSSQLLSKFYLVDVKDQGILMVKRIYDGERTRAFKVFQLILDGKDWKLIKKEYLGDIALFVGGSSTVAFAVSSVSGCLANHIYFLQDWNGIAREDAWRDD